MVSWSGEAWGDAEAQRGHSAAFTALELHGVVPVFKKTERGKVDNQCEVRILGNPLSVQDTSGHWLCGSEQITTVEPERMAVLCKGGEVKTGGVTVCDPMAAASPHTAGDQWDIQHMQTGEGSPLPSLAGPGTQAPCDTGRLHPRLVPASIRTLPPSPAPSHSSCSLQPAELPLCAFTEVFLFTECSQVGFSPHNPPKAARGWLRRCSASERAFGSTSHSSLLLS